MTYKYNPFWQQRIRETVRHALDVHPRLTALRVDLRLPDVPAATDAAVISRFINALKARIDCNQVNHLIPTRVLVKGGEITCKILK